MTLGWQAQGLPWFCRVSMLIIYVISCFFEGLCSWYTPTSWRNQLWYPQPAGDHQLVGASCQLHCSCHRQESLNWELTYTKSLKRFQCEFQDPKTA
jgi:hypothetical protein